jgi:hypothetical protein
LDSGGRTWEKLASFLSRQNRLGAEQLRLMLGAGLDGRRRRREVVLIVGIITDNFLA